MKTQKEIRELIGDGSSRNAWKIQEAMPEILETCLHLYTKVGLLGQTIDELNAKLEDEKNKRIEMQKWAIREIKALARANPIQAVTIEQLELYYPHDRLGEMPSQKKS